MDTAKWDKWWDVCLSSVWPVWQMGCSLSFHCKLGERERAHERGHGVGAYAPRLLSAWIHARPCSGDLPSLKTGLSHWVLILLRSLASGPLPDPPSHHKVTASATFCHPRVSRTVFSSQESAIKVDYWSTAGPQWHWTLLVNGCLMDTMHSQSLG